MRTALFICLFSLAALATVRAEDVDPPGRVARLSYADGDVSLAPAGSEEWAEAVLNRPLTSGDRLWVDNGGRAELQVGSSNVHLDQGSGFSFVDLDDDNLHMKLTEGAATVRVLRKRESESIEIETPNATVALLHPGEYHIEVNEAGDQTVVKARSGESEVIGDRKSYTVRANEEGVFKGTAELTADIGSVGPRTAFESWANDRDRRDQESQSARYVSRDVIGYQDLDRYGDWVTEPGYGSVWRPTYVVSGWAPYRYGRWVWVSPWGWSWVDDAPWGFAPFHYGRWAYVSSRWCWVPGPIYARPVYAPALVAWTGSPGLSVSLSFGSGIGWFPLGPREVYVPAYRYSPRYIRSVNVWHTTIINNTYVYNGRGRHNYLYGRDPRAVTVVDRGRFVGGRPIDGHWTRPDERDLRRWHHDARPPAIAPDRDSVLASRVVSRPPLGRVARSNVERSDVNWSNRAGARNAQSRVPFEVERRAIEANGGRPVSRDALMRANPQNGNELRADRSQNRGTRPARDADSRRPDRTNPPALTAREQPSQPVAQQPAQRADRPAWARGNDRRVVREQNEPVARSPRSQDRTPDVSSPTVRTPSVSNNDAAAPARSVTDRPSWAGQRRDDSPRANASQQREREQPRNWSRQPTSQPERSEPRPTMDRSTPSVNSLRDSRDNSRPSNRNLGVTTRFEQSDRARSADRAWQQPAQPRYSAPREQPRVQQPRVSQPQAEPRPRAVEPPRAQYGNQGQSARPQNNDSRGNQPRSFDRQNPGERRR